MPENFMEPLRCTNLGGAKVVNECGVVYFLCNKTWKLRNLLQIFLLYKIFTCSLEIKLLRELSSLFTIRKVSEYLEKFEA